MKTITFYSYKGGTGRSLALANAARYLARLEFKVVALDFDLEAPGLHYKFSLDIDGQSLPVEAGVVDYLHTFVVEGKVPESLKGFTHNVTVPGVDRPLVQLIPAGLVPSRDYWLKLSRINWHDLFYSKGAKGVQVFLDLKARIADELDPDFLLIDSRTGITEMGGVATTLLADKVICLVLPTPENLEGARAVLRSLKRSRRESGIDGLELMVALSRLPHSESEQGVTDRIRSVLNEEAEDLADTLSFSDIFTLHSETALEVRETLRVGSDISPDDSILLRDYLRLFANVVPKELIEPKVSRLIEQAREKIWVDPAAAVKEVEELAESFGHPETYRALLTFYEVRNVAGISGLKRAQRLWELTRDSHDVLLWRMLNKTFDATLRTFSWSNEWVPDMDFVEAVWRDAGKRNPDFAIKIAQVYQQQDREFRGADILLEVIEHSEASAMIVSRCIQLLDASNRATEADLLIQQLKPKMANAPRFVEAWANHVIQNKQEVVELLQSPADAQLENISPSIAAQVYFKGGLLQQAEALTDKALKDIMENPISERGITDIALLFQTLDRWEEFESALLRRYPTQYLDNVRKLLKMPRRRSTGALRKLTS